MFQSGAIALDEHHRAMASLTLSPAVPEDVLVQFETAKNLICTLLMWQRRYESNDRYYLGISCQ
jgi:hypothetical protein